MDYLLAFIIGLIAGAVSGWYGKGRFGAKVAKVVTDIKASPKP